MKKVEVVESLVRAGEIKKIESKGNTPHYEIMEINRQEIAKKTKLALRYELALKNRLMDTAIKYEQTPNESENDMHKKLDLLVDIEELVKTIAWYKDVSWQTIWEKGKMGSMIGFKRYARVGEPTLKGCVQEYLAFGDIDDLCYIQTALFEELKKMNSNYGVFYLKFEDKRKAKKKAQGSFKQGYYLKSIEYNQNATNDLNSK